MQRVFAFRLFKSAIQGLCSTCFYLILVTLDMISELPITSFASINYAGITKEVGQGFMNQVSIRPGSSGITICQCSVEQLPIWYYYYYTQVYLKIVLRYCFKEIISMKALLGMAKERRKQENENRPLTKLNLQKKPPQPQPSDHEQEMEFEQQYEPEIQQILGYAEYIGIKLPQEEDLLYIAKEGLMANLPPEWDEQETEDGNILYINRRSGEVIAEHPCDQYYRQLVIKERKKKGGNKPKFGGIQPVGGIGQASKAMPMQQIQPPRKDIDPLVKMEQEKKKKKLEEQKRKEFEDKKKQIAEKFDKKKEAIEADYKTKEKKLRDKCEQTIQNERSKMMKKMSQEQRAQQQKTKKEMERFQRETRAKLEKKYYDKRSNEKDRIQKVMKAKRQQIRLALQGQFKVHKKQVEEEYKEKLKILAEKQRNQGSQKSQTQLLNQQLETMKHQIIQRRLKQHSEKLNKQKQQQQQIYRTKIQQLQRSHEETIRALETSAPKTQIKFDTLAQQVEQSQKQELEALQYELSMIREVKKAEKQYQLEKYRKLVLEENNEELARMERQNDNLITKLRKVKEQEYQSRVAQGEKKLKQAYLNSLKHLHQKFTQQQQIIQLQSHPLSNPKHPSQDNSLQLLNQLESNLHRKEESLRGEIEALQEEISKLGKKNRPLRHRLTDQQLRMYELVREKLVAV